MSWAAYSFDVLLAVALVGLAWCGLRTRDLFSGIVLFIVFGLLVALAWVRLHAPDLALAEAAIGSGLTGALFLAALARMERLSGVDADGRGTPAPRVQRGVAVLLALTLAAVLFRAVWALPPTASGLGPLVHSRLAESGVKNPVTAVILNFRGYDTLLEIGVLLLAVLSVQAIYVRPEPAVDGVDVEQGGPVLLAFVRLLTPFMLMVAAYLLWVGAFAPGGAFQGGALMGGLGVVLLLAGGGRTLNLDGRGTRYVLVLGFAVFLLVGLGVMDAGHFLEYPGSSAKHLMLLIEAACMISIGLILAALFGACAGLVESGERPEGEPRP